MPSGSLSRSPSVTNSDLILDFLKSIAPADASNAEISGRTGVRPHQQVFMITRTLLDRGEIRAERVGREWRFSWNKGGDTLSEGTRAAVVSTEPAIQFLPHAWDSATSVQCHLGMTWTPLGRLSLIGGRIHFPKAPPVPGLYRFRVRSNGGEARYFGETENLARRFAFYRSPGPS
jgi:hypothetical protein